MTHAAERFSGSLACEEVSLASDRMIGLAIASLTPALFWTVILSVVCQAAGYTAGPAVLLTFAASVASFLALVVKALQSQGRA